jgi:hypothetical protein
MVPKRFELRRFKVGCYVSLDTVTSGRPPSDLGHIGVGKTSGERLLKFPNNWKDKRYRFSKSIRKRRRSPSPAQNTFSQIQCNTFQDMFIQHTKPMNSLETRPTIFSHSPPTSRHPLDPNLNQILLDLGIPSAHADNQVAHVSNRANKQRQLLLTQSQECMLCRWHSRWPQSQRPLLIAEGYR